MKGGKAGAEAPAARPKGTRPIYEEVRAGDIHVGDHVNRARTRAFYEVIAAEPEGAKIALTLKDAGTSAPRKTSIWWRQIGSEDV